MNSKHVIAIQLADARRAEQLACALAGDRVECIVAENTDAFYHRVNTERVDLVVLEHRLPGFLMGLEILERLHHDLLRPTTVLLAAPDAALEIRAKAAGVDRLLDPSDGMEALAAPIASLLTAAQCTKALIPQEARELVRCADGIQPLPQLLVKLCAFLQEEFPSVSALAKDLSVDPKVTAELLRLVNSSALGRSHKAGRVFDAVNALGPRRTIALVVSMSVVRTQSELLRSLPPWLRHWYHSRSVLTASTASSFAAQLDQVSPDTAHVLGLLQDMGVLIMAQQFGDRYTALVERVREKPLLQLEQCETESFGVNHAAVSAALLQKWELPQSLISLVLDHHSEEATANHSDLEQRFLRVMRIGEAMANLADQATLNRQQKLNRLLEQYDAAQRERCAACLRDAVARTIEASELFSIPVPDEEALEKLLKQATASDLPPAEAATDSNPSEESLPSESPPQSSRKAILVVEDDPLVVRAIQGFTAPLGMEIRSCARAAEAALLALGSDVVLCDVHLGAETGIDVVRRLRKGGYRKPVIMITGDATRRTVERCIEEGVSDYLLKPFSRADLLAKLSKHTGIGEPAAVAAG